MTVDLNQLPNLRMAVESGANLTAEEASILLAHIDRLKAVATPEALGEAVQEAIVGAYDAGASQALRDVTAILTDMIDGPYSQRDDGLRFAVHLIRGYASGASWAEVTRGAQ